jgi:hypothetical protein
MPELYIGNATKQVHQFTYRSPERPGVIVQTIPMGGQVQISPNGVHRDLSTPEIDAIIAQHRTYGIISIEEVDQMQGPFDGLCYSIGKPISMDKLHRVMKKKDDLMQHFGQKMRQEAALAVNQQIEGQIGPLRQLEMSFIEEEPKSGYSDDLTHLSEGVRVTRDQDINTISADPGRRGKRR